MAQNRAEVQQRDQDLTEADDFLTEDKLDRLWEWFCTEASQDKHLIFAKLVNAARKPYRDAFVLGRGNENYGASTTRYTPSESTITTAPAEQQHQSVFSEDIQVLQTKLAIVECALETQEASINQLQEGIQKNQQRAEEENRKLHSVHATIRAEHELSPHTGRTRIVLKVAHWVCRFIGAQDQTNVAMQLNQMQVFTLLSHPNGMYSFETTTTPIAYLSAEGPDVRAVENDVGGAVTFSAECGSREKFWFHDVGNARLYIEPVDFPGRFLTTFKPHQPGASKGENDRIWLQGWKSGSACFIVAITPN
ncbi:hypothetical protein BDZ91DRAFT_849816 [Kalaharituber pfeilii]|nr:hypothetical protein BDZ91DRAFT_849816 [Kalaharituber pfeilii]